MWPLELIGAWVRRACMAGTGPGFVWLVLPIGGHVRAVPAQEYLD